MSGADRAAGRVRWTGLTAFAERVAARLAREVLAESELAEVARAIEGLSRRMEQAIKRDGLGAADLTPATREWRGWVAWLSSAGNVAAYREAVARAVRALEPRRRAHLLEARRHVEPAPLLVRFFPIRHIYKLRSRGPAATLTMPTPMTRFDEGGFADLAAMVFGRDRHAKPRVVERMLGEAYADLAAELEALGGVVDATRGAHHDLGEVFERVNVRYFRPPLARPRLTWSKTLTRRKFGHYDHVRDTVMVSSTLDHASVPAFVVDYLMFHELLHKRHGIRWVNGRGMAHTAAFYADERRFERLAEAEGWLKKLARGQ